MRETLSGGFGGRGFRGRSIGIRALRLARLRKEEVLEEQERAQILQKALQRLSEDHREVLLLKIWAEMTFAEIAQTLNENPNTVAARYRYALANLKKLLPADCHE